MRHQPFTLLIHIALALILVGALVTHFFGIQGSLTLYSGNSPVSVFEKESGPGDGRLPFAVQLENVDIDYYPATTTPMDYRSLLLIEGTHVKVSMNKVGEYRGWRFCQSGMSADSSTLSISHDPWGIGITYSGYFLLGLGMIGYFFQRNTAWRAMLHKYRKFLAAVTILSSFSPALSAEGRLPAMQRPLASNLGKVLVYWNDRICPLQTMALDVTGLLYGSDSYDGYTAEQVLSGWIFYYDQWERDYMETHPSLESVSVFRSDRKNRKDAERLAVIRWMGTGDAFSIYPYVTVDGHMEWLSLTGRKPSGMSLDQWTFMQTSMPQIKALLMSGKNVESNVRIDSLISWQRRYGGDCLPSPEKINAERLFNRTVSPVWCAILSLIIGLALLIFTFFKQHAGITKVSGFIISVLLLLYLCYSMGLLWYVGGHIPVSNGQETMMFMSLTALAAAVFCRDSTIRGALMLVAGLALCVASMGGRAPQIGSMMPVLSSPLLSVHVMIVMISYALFLMMAVVAVLALASKSENRFERLSTLNRLMLTPAVCLLGAGIFIGAVWANQTWGRYWGWDPKETCALVMWFVYALPLHWRSRQFRFFRSDKVLNVYLLIAILTVAFTYFGANYLLKGLHSYA